MKKIILESLLALILIFLISIFPAAMNTGFSTETLNTDTENILLNNLSISLITEEPINKPIVCFDVNDAGMIALGLRTHDKKTICVYNENGFQYGYEFNDSGSFGIEWDETNINIYLIRSDVIVSVNPLGKIEEVFKVQNTFENNSYQNHSIFSTKRIVGNRIYTIQNDMGILNIFASSYSQLVVTESNDEEKIIYDINKAQMLKTILMIIGVIVFAGIVAAGLVSQQLKTSKKGFGNTGDGSVC